MSNTPLDLPTLRRFFGTRNDSDGRWVYRPNVIGDDWNRPRISDISQGVGEDTIWGIQCKLELAVMQLVKAARAGDQEALRSLVLAVSNAAQELSLLAPDQPENVKALAETVPYWPLRMSLNPQDIKRSKAYLKELGVGMKAPTPTSSGQRIDRHGFWSSLAQQARQACLLNTFAVPALMELARDAKGERRSKKYWGGKNEETREAMYFNLASGDVVIIADWQDQCRGLSARVTAQNFTDWWRALQGCALDHWHCYPKEYQKALSQLGDIKEKDYRKRNLALTSLRQTFRGLVGLRSKAK